MKVEHINQFGGGGITVSQSLFDEFYFSCTLRIIDVTKLRSEIHIHFFSFWKMDSRKSHHALFSSCIMAMIWLVLELLLTWIFVFRDTTLIIYLIMAISPSSSPLILCLSINFSGVTSPVCLLLFVIVEDMWSIEDLGEIKGFSHAKFITMRSLINIY